jgi:hypothetical protein
MRVNLRNEFGVAQIFNLLYRRFLIGWPLPRCANRAASDSWRIENPRYSRLKICATSLALPLWLAASSPAAPVSLFLHTQSQDILNEKGEKVLLRGVGLGNWLLPEGYMWKFGNQGDRPRRIEKITTDLLGPEKANRFWHEFRENYITEADIQRIAELGYNSVRPAINSRVLLTQSDPPECAEEGFRLLDHLIAWCKASGIYVILDMHAAPGGQTGQNIDDSANDEPDLFIDPKYEDQLVALWTAIAKRYKDEPAVAGYDLLNEPLPARTGAEAKFKARLEPLYQKLTKAIRGVDPKHIVILEGADWANDWSVFTQPFDGNLVYQFHYYCWDHPAALKSIENYLNHRQRLNAPVWVGETGERDNAIYWATTEYFEANNIGWSFWPWKKMETRNTPCSIKAPSQWQAVVAYSRGGPKPSSEVAQAAFTELLNNILLDRCIIFPDVVNAMLRQAPARIEAENYGQEGFNKSYFVKDTRQLSKAYRTSEPIPVSTLGTSDWRSGQYITLGATEWTAYTIRSAAPKKYQLTARAKAAAAPAEAQLILGDQVLRAALPGTGWSEINLGTVTLAQGPNRLVWRVTRGVTDLDWVELTSLPATENKNRASTTMDVRQNH